MKISRKSSASGPSRVVLAVLLLLVFVGGFLLGQQGWLNRIMAVPADLATRLRAEPTGASLPTLAVDMTFDNYNTILEQRSEALETGVYIGGEEDFVPATIRLFDADGEQQVPVRMRLIQGPAASLGEDEKWGISVRTRDDALLLDMQRFTLKDPALNNWLHQWAFTRSVQREGLLAARYRFAGLVFNGEELGIYGVQEGFGDELLLAQERPVGIILEFAPERLWESIRLFGGDMAAALADPVANLSIFDYQFSEVDVFRDAQLDRDEERLAQKNVAIGLIRGFQAGDLTAAQVFDLEKYGTFLALVDLWGATDALSLSNLRYYYDPSSSRLEPIAYNANPLASPARIAPAAMYDDPDLQTAFVRAADRISRPDYLEELRTALEPELDQLQAALGSENEQELPWEAIQERQRQMRLSLEPVQPVLGYLGPQSLNMDGVIQVDVANVLNLPVEVAGFDIGGATFLEARPEMLQGEPSAVASATIGSIALQAADSETPDLRFVRFHLPLTEIHQLDSELTYLQEIEIHVATRILGQDEVQLTRLLSGNSNPISAPD